MRDTNLVNALREHAEWARANEWETPITLGDDLTEAADRIEAQAKEIEKLRGQNEQLREAAALVAKESVELLERRWIPVEERLPELETPVLVLDRRRNQMVRTLRKLSSDKEPVFRPDGLAPGKHITHWMPLPEPPEVENAEAK